MTLENINRVKHIQNSQCSLGWGSSALSDTETLFVVGHSYYRGDIKCFTITDDFAMYIVEKSNHKRLIGEYAEFSECVSKLLSLLKEWFPPIGLKDTANNTHKGGLASAT